MNRVLIRSSAFVRAAKKYVRRHPEQTDALFESLAQMEQDAFHPSLRTHKLTGVLSGSWACSAGYDLRIVFRFVKHDGTPAILLEGVGTHDEVY